MNERQLHLGAAFYPEQWTPAHWAEDIALMKKAGFTVARMGEFAWSSFEPQEGEFRFDWMDEAITMLAENGIQTVMGTPTAAPPAWMVQQYPEVLRTGEDGRKVQFGNRCHYCVESPHYHDLTQKMVSAMAAHFGPNPAVIGWQIDNEFGAACHCELCRSAFQQYLQAHYGSLEELNRRWTTSYWSQTYSDWSQIELPRGKHNPGLMMAYRKYFTDAYRRYQQLQIDALRAHIPAAQWITHNFHGSMNGLDHFQMAQDLDVVSYDYYVGSGNNDAALSGMKWDLARGLKQDNFWVMETQPASVNWSTINNKLNKGEARALAWQAIGHGADAILYWQWRSALNGQEQYHGTLVNQAGKPRPFYEEAAELGDDLKRIGGLLNNTQVAKNQVAILFDFESRWSLEREPLHKDFDYWTAVLRYYRPLQQMNIGVDIISPEVDISGYKLVIAPYMIVIDEQRANKLVQFADKGGHVVLTCRTGVKDHDDAMLPQYPPACGLARIAGVEVEEYYPLEHALPLKADLFNGAAHIWAEKLRPLPFKLIVPMVKYQPGNGWLDGSPAVTSLLFGRGTVYYVGCILDAASQEKFLQYVVNGAHLKPALADVPYGMEVCVRETAEGERYTILINHQNQALQFNFPEGSYEYITRSAYHGLIKVPPYAVAVIGEKEPDIGESL
jgi:beta-galactosidase